MTNDSNHRIYPIEQYALNSTKLEAVYMSDSCEFTIEPELKLVLMQ